MWMMGCNDGAELNLHDSFNSTSRKLRPLIPRPLPSTNNTPTSNPPCLSRIHGSADFFAQYHHLATVAEHNKREFNTSPQVLVSSRWNPTPEQLRALEELYRRGTRTPSAEQIQHITAQLRRYGKIEGKNVFYWFQNHKARERQKRRRQMESAPEDRELDMPEKNKEIGASRTVFEVEQTKNWAPPTNCSTLAEESHVSIQRAAGAPKAGVVGQGAESCIRTDGRIQLGEGELHLQHKRNNFVERNATWQMMQLSCPHPHTSLPTNLINTPNITNTTTTTTTRTRTTTSRTTASAISSTMDQRLIKTSTNDLSIFITPAYRSENGLINNGYNYLSSSKVNPEEEDYNNNCSEESQTLELFPLRSGDDNGSEKENHDQILSVSAMNAGVMTTPCQFFEFLPLKN